MFAELVCLETIPAKWHGGASIFRGLAVWWANDVTFNLLRQLASPSWREREPQRIDGDGQRRRNW
jgi:hypothetical protein